MLPAVPARHPARAAVFSARHHLPLSVPEPVPIHTVYIELPRTPIYHRIATALGAALSQRGLQVMAVKPDGFDHASYLAFVQQHGRVGSGAAYVSTARGNIVQSRQPGSTHCFFEAFEGPLVFLHQDTLLGVTPSPTS